MKKKECILAKLPLHRTMKEDKVEDKHVELVKGGRNH